MGYKIVVIATATGFAHASVINNIKKVSDMLSVKDEKITSLVEKVNG